MRNREEQVKQLRELCDMNNKLKKLREYAEKECSSYKDKMAILRILGDV